MKKIGGLIALLFISFHLLSSQSSKWEKVVAQFQTEFEALDMPGLRIGYIENLENIQSLDAIEKQAEVFETLRGNLSNTNYADLDRKQQIEYDLLNYLLALNLERIQLEKEWRLHPVDSISTAGLYHIPNGKRWYQYFLKRLIDQPIDPDALFEFGMAEIHKVLGEMKDLQERSGMDSLAFQQHIHSEEFFYTKVEEVQQAFEELDAEIIKTLPKYFPDITEIPNMNIEQGNIPRMAQVPAYYTNNTFYYNFFNNTYNKRQVVWTYMHEGLPGHHYERSYSNSLDLSPIQELYMLPGYSEGWAAYIEEIGIEIGAYKDIYDELGKWEWDIIRSVRVPLDVGLNYYGWSDEKALQFWKKYIKGQDDIGLREIARMKRWPCQVITYKYGADKILNWKEKLEKQPNFNLKAFHTKVLQNGPLPFSILEPLILKEVD